MKNVRKPFVKSLNIVLGGFSFASEPEISGKSSSDDESFWMFVKKNEKKPFWPKKLDSATFFWM